jgi:hypothetical protein
MSDSAIKSLSQDEQIFRDLVWSPVITAGIVAIQTYLPLLKFPIIGPIFKGIIALSSDWIFGQIIKFIDITAIKLSNAAHEAAYNDASLKLKIIAHDKGVDSPEFLEARSAAKDALSRFTMFNQ